MVLGKQICRPAKLDRQLARDLKALAHRDDPYDTVIGKTMCSNDFYEGQGRLDGAFCEFTEAEKMDYLMKLQKAGVVNIEMESLCFAALTHHAGIQSAVVCVTLLDRLKGDQVYIIYIFSSTEPSCAREESNTYMPRTRVHRLSSAVIRVLVAPPLRASCKTVIIN